MISSIPTFLVLRTPEHNEESRPRSLFPDKPSLLGEMYYSGIDRLAWSELDGNHYSRTLPTDLENVRERMHGEGGGEVGICTTYIYDEALAVLRFANCPDAHSEVCVVASLDRKNLSLGLTQDEDVRWLGVDIYVSGYGSAIREGLFRKPEAFLDFIPRLNEAGLFAIGDGEVFAECRSALLDKAEQYDLEVFPAFELLWNYVKIGRVI